MTARSPYDRRKITDPELVKEFQEVEAANRAAADQYREMPSAFGHAAMRMWEVEE